MMAIWINLRKFGSVFLLVIAFTTLLVGITNTRPANAKVLAVTTRYVAPSGNDVGDCSSATLPCRTIQYAVNRALSGDTILVAQGTYTYNQSADTCTFLPPTGKSVVCIVDKTLNILGGYSTSNWATANPKVNLTIIDGQNTYRGVFLLGYNLTTVSLTMEGFTIQNGWAKGPNTPGDPSGFGGGMIVSGARVTLRDMSFKNNRVYGDNTSSGAGGAGAGAGLAINWSQPGTSNLLERVTFEGNQSYGGTGPERGGVVYGALFVNASITINYGTFINNQAFAGSSAGSGRFGDLNADALGGAIGGGGGSWVLRRIVATGNQVVGGNGTLYAGGGFGGGIFVEKATSFSITDSYLSGNMAVGGNALNGGFGAGGGILVDNTSATIDRVYLIANSAIGGNTTSTGNAGAGGGGGLYLWKTNPAVAMSASVTNAVITDNYVTMGSIGGTAPGGGGGGIQVQGAQATISHATIARNRLGPALVAGQGLLVLAAPGVSSASATVNHSIIADHTEGGPGAVAVLVQQGNTLTFNRGIFSNNTQNTNADGSPMLPGTINGLSTMQSVQSVGFISPGSPHYNYHLRYNSAAKDQAVGSTTVDDIDGQGRPCNNVSDFGADEHCPFALSVIPGDGTLRLDWTNGASVLSGGVAYYEVLVTCASGANPPAQGNCAQPINVGGVTTFTLTGLSNSKQYTVAVKAYDSSGVLLANSATVTAIPTDTPFYLYLPLILK